ncbi:MAG: hypothetical protein JNK38_04775 [Acidobacteria bacterium]|nr:hypothetical protein [Acidobacteriota bacterium]
MWWLYPYDDSARLAWVGSGFGGQMPIIIPEYDLVIVFTGWNTFGDTKRLCYREAIERVLRAVTKPQTSTPK